MQFFWSPFLAIIDSKTGPFQPKNWKPNTWIQSSDSQSCPSLIFWSTTTILIPTLALAINAQYWKWRRLYPTHSSKSNPLLQFSPPERYFIFLHLKLPQFLNWLILFDCYSGEELCSNGQWLQDPGGDVSKEGHTPSILRGCKGVL